MNQFYNNDILEKEELKDTQMGCLSLLIFVGVLVIIYLLLRGWFYGHR